MSPAYEDFSGEMEHLEDPFLGDILGSLTGEEEGEWEDWEELYPGDVAGIGESGDFEDLFLGDGSGGLLGEAGDMEYLAEAAAESESLAEADGFIGALVPLATSLLPSLLPMAKSMLPQVLGAARKVVPQLIRGATRIGRRLLRSPSTKPLVRTLPTIVRNTVKSVARQAASGTPVTPAQAMKTLGTHARRVLRSPQRRRGAVRHCRRMAHCCARRRRASMMY